MSEERLKFEGRLWRLEIKTRKLELRLKGELKAIRNILDPYKPIADVKFDEAMSLVVTAAGAHIDYKGLLYEMELIKKDLGID